MGFKLSDQPTTHILQSRRYWMKEVGDLSHLTAMLAVTDAATGWTGQYQP